MGNANTREDKWIEMQHYYTAIFFYFLKGGKLYTFTTGQLETLKATSHILNNLRFDLILSYLIL